MSYYKKVCFTLNNWQEEELQKLLKIEWIYVTIGKEVGKEGAPHLQGAGELKKRRQLKALQELCPRAHWEKMKGTPKQATAYCKKDGDFIESGIVPEGITKNGIKEAMDKVKDSGMRGLLDSDTTVSTLRYAAIWLTYKEKSRQWKPHVTWLWGASGAGKSRMAAEMGGENVYWKDSEKWWDGYDAHETTIIDDFRPSQMKFSALLKLLDRYPLRLEVKGGYRQMLSTKIIITTIVHPENCYHMETEEPIKQLIRRIDDIIHVRDIRCDEVMISENEMAVTSMSCCSSQSVGNTMLHSESLAASSPAGP